jgi:Fe-S-cluster containining protein
MPADNGPTYSFNVCSKCKSICCQDAKPPLTKRRKRMIMDCLKGQKSNFKSIFVTENYSYPNVDEEVYCLLFNRKTGKCIVHAVKPETCVSGPITFDIDFKNKKVEFFLKKSEICAYAGILFEDKISFNRHFEAAKKQLMILIGELSNVELRAIIKIEEPQTFKVGEDDLPADVIKKLGL